MMELMHLQADAGRQMQGPPCKKALIVYGIAPLHLKYPLPPLAYSTLYIDIMIPYPIRMYTLEEEKRNKKVRKQHA